MKRRSLTAFGVLAVLSLVGWALFASPTSATEGVRYIDEVFSEVQVTRDIPYGEAPDEYGQSETLRLDLYEPSNDSEMARPVLVWVHGGGFVFGDKAWPGDADMAESFATRGWVALSINYRLRDTLPAAELSAATTDAQHDAQAAVRWLRKNALQYRIDPERVTVAGYSAGAVTALYVNYNSSDAGESGNPGFPSNVSASVDISGWTNTALIDSGEPPVLVIHGREDVFPVTYAEDIVARGSEVGAVVEAHLLEDVGHFVLTTNKEDAVVWMADFFYRRVIDPMATSAHDDDGDSFADNVDNCPALSNPLQEDLDGKGLGDVCDPDDDGDGADDYIDNCPRVVNPDQANTDAERPSGPAVPGKSASNPAGDDLGDVCDPDDDNDGLSDAQEFDDKCPYRLVADSDGDGSLDGFEVSLGVDPCNSRERPVCRGNLDSDGDGFTDCVEQSGYNTCAFVGDIFPGYTTCSDPTDSDSDGCPDWIEIVDVNGNRSADSLDVLLITKRAFRLAPPSDSDSALDIDKSGSVNMMDAFQVVRNSSLVKPHSPCEPEG